MHIRCTAYDPAFSEDVRMPFPGFGECDAPGSMSAIRAT